jgi:hypothetical protein
MTCRVQTRGNMLKKKRLMENSGSWVPGKRRFRGGFRVLVDGRMLLSN